MRLPGHRWTARFASIVIIALFGHSLKAQTATARIDEALQNITTLQRPGRVGYATIWSGNSYVQCRRMPERSLRCEAAGTTMQPSLRHVFSPERQARLAEQGWALDPAFGNHVRTFPAEMPTGTVAEHLLLALVEAYGVDAAGLDLKTAWIADMPCPPRNGASQNLAGSVNDAPEMRMTALRACSYSPDPALQPRPAETREGLLALYGASTAAEIQRLRINKARRVHVVLSAGIGYVQCVPAPSEAAILCEAQSAESWPALAAILTAERRARLREAGYAEPGRRPNYWRLYPLAGFSDAEIARELLTLLHDVYGYTGTVTLKVSTE